MTTFTGRVHVPRTKAQTLYEEITAQSSDLGERLAMLSQRSKTGALAADVAEVRERLWAEFRNGE